MLGTGYLQTTFLLGHLPHAQRVSLLNGLCQAIQDDLDHRGPDPQLMMLGAALSYCASLIGDAGGDQESEAVDAALAQLEGELGLLLQSLRATWHRPGEPAAREAAAELLAVLFPCGQIPVSLGEVRRLVQLGKAPGLRKAVDRLGCRRHLGWVEDSLCRADESIERCYQSLDEMHLRARNATRFADGLLRRLLGHVVAVTDPGDEEQQARAGALLGPLEEALALDAGTAGAWARLPDRGGQEQLP